MFRLGSGGAKAVLVYPKNYAQRFVSLLSPEPEAFCSAAHVCLLIQLGAYPLWRTLNGNSLVREPCLKRQRPHPEARISGSPVTEDHGHCALTHSIVVT